MTPTICAFHLGSGLVCLALGAGLSAACSSPQTAIPSLITPTPSDVESLIGTRIIAENDAVLEATVQEKGKDIHVAVVISDNTGLAAAKILLDRIIKQLGEMVKGDNYSYSITMSSPDGNVVVGAVADPIDRFLDNQDRR